ncbi:hypothetical protein NC651_002018 [Populus alba x Populus x berolinensis]|nr:hypothetical protein NC651_002018 [Populus alba x Populus x berolinensis]
MPDSCREVLQGQGYFGLVLAFELKLLAMGCCVHPCRCAVSGSGKITMHVLEKLIAYGQSQYQKTCKKSDAFKVLQAVVSLYKVGVASVIPYGINISSFVTFKPMLEG